MPPFAINDSYPRYETFITYNEIDSLDRMMHHSVKAQLYKYGDTVYLKVPPKASGYYDNNMNLVNEYLYEPERLLFTDRMYELAKQSMPLRIIDCEPEHDAVWYRCLAQHGHTHAFRAMQGWLVKYPMRDVNISDLEFYGLINDKDEE